MKVILASHNLNKVKEFKKLVKPLGIELISLKDLKDFKEIEETGQTFIENATLKAETISKKYNLPTIADDSGLEVYSLDDRPGIYSARYSGKGDQKNNLKILNELKNIENREARFICVIAFKIPNQETKIYQGIWEGSISHEILGEKGFGYDPIFIPKNHEKTVGQLEPTIKDKESHRAKALNLFYKDLLR